MLYPPSRLDANQVLQYAFDESTQTLRVNATFSGSIGDVGIVDADGHELNVNADGSINSNLTGAVEVELSAADGDSVIISDGVDNLAVNADGSINVLGPLTDAQLRASAVPISAASLPLPAGAATAANQTTGNTSIASVATNTTNLQNTIAAEGAAQPSHGQVVMGHNGSGVARHILVDSSGRQVVNINGTVPVAVDKDRELVSVAYTVTTAFTGASLGDVISGTHIYDVSTGTPSLIASIWRNETLNTTLGSAPTMGNLSASLSLTNAELRSSAVPVSVAGVATAANQSTTNTSLASIDTKTPALDNTRQPVIPSMFTGGNLSAQTNATGTNWTAYGSQALKQLTVSNQTGTTLEFRQGGAGVGLQVPTGAFYTFFGITNANQIEVRRVDTSNTQVTCTARWES